MNKKGQGEMLVVGVIVVFIIAIIVGAMFVMPIYNVWAKEKKGEASLAEAEWDRQIQIAEAEANLEAQSYNADAEIIRAAGVAEANLIIAGSLDEQYLRYLWIQGLNDGSSEVIYVATEAGLPILEAGRLSE
jgi:hypothetical protein